MILPSRVCILLPTRFRHDGLRRVLDSLASTAPDCIVIVATDPEDPMSRLIATTYHCVIATCPDNKLGCVVAWNWALRHALTTSLAFVSAADDVVFQPDWLERSLQALHEMGDSGLVGFNDDKLRYYGTSYWWATHYMMTRDFIIDHLGGVFCPPVYRNDYTDWEVSAIAIRADKFRMCEDAHVTHLWKGPDGDETYSLAKEHRKESKLIYEQRKAKGFPITWKPILTA
jgi:hypothetical protein